MMRAPLILLLVLAAPAAGQGTLGFWTVDGPPDADGPAAIAATPDGKELAVAHRDSDCLTFLDAATGALLAVVPVGDEPLDVELDGAGHALVPCAGDGSLAVVDVATHSRVASVPLSVPRPYRVLARPAAGMALVAASDASGSAAAVVDIATWLELHAFPTAPQDELPRLGLQHDLDEVGPPIPGHVRVDLSADGNLLVVPSFELRRVSVYDVPSGSLLASLPTSLNPVAAALTSDAGRCAIWGSTLGFVGGIQVLDLASLTLTPAVDVSYGADPEGVVISPDDRRALIAGDSDLVAVDLATGAIVEWVFLQYAYATRIALSDDGARAFCSCPDLAVVDLALRKVVAWRKGDGFEDVAAVPLGVDVALLRHRVAEDVTVVRTDVPPFLPDRFRAPSGPEPEGDGTTALAVSQDGGIVLACDVQSRELVLFERDALRARIPLALLPRCLAMDRGGRVAIVGSAIDGTVEVVDLAAGRSRGTLSLGATQVFAAGMSADGATAWARTAKHLCFVATTSPPALLASLDASLAWYYGDRVWQRRVDASPDGRLLSVPVQIDSSGHAYSIVDVATRSELARLPLPGAKLPYDSAFRSDGRAVFVTAGGDALLRVALEGSAPEKAGKVFLNDPAQLAIGPGDRYVYVAGKGQNSLQPHLSVVDGEALSWVMELDLPAPAVALEAAGPYVFAALEDGSLLRFLAAGPATALVETIELGQAATDLVVDPVHARVLLAQPGKRDGLSVVSYPAEPEPLVYCSPANPNSTGAPATIAARGWFRASGWFELVAEDLPPNELGFFLVGDTRVFVPLVGGSQGDLCVGGAVGRFASALQSTGADGRMTLAVDTTALPLADGPRAVQPGETWCFQAWTTDANPLPTANLSDALGVTFP